MPEEFDILAAKVLAGEASAVERARLDELLSRHPELATELAQLQATWEMVLDAGPVVPAIHASARPIPPDRLRQLEAVVRQRFANPAADPAKTIAQSDARLDTSALQLRQADSGTPSYREQRGSFLNYVRQALLGRAQPAPAVWLAPALIFLVLASYLIWRPRNTQVSTLAPHGTTTGYVIPTRGSVEIRRGGQRIPVQTAFALEAPDKLILRPGAVAFFALPTGVTELQGPQQLAAATLAHQVSSPIRSAASNIVADPIPPTAKSFQTAVFPEAALPTTAGLLIATRSERSIPLYSPLGTTAQRTPLVLWKAEPGKTYDLAIGDALASDKPALRLTGVTSPVDLAQAAPAGVLPLAANGLYRITIQETGKPFTASEYSVRTIRPDSLNAPEEKLVHAYRLLSSRPDQLGDALAELMTLPPDAANCELALRLKLFAFGQAGYQDDFEAAAAKLKAQPTPH